MGLRLGDEEPQVPGTYRGGRTGLKTQQELAIKDVLRFLVSGNGCTCSGARQDTLHLRRHQG
jgi:hypothetical protein